MTDNTKIIINAKLALDMLPFISSEKSRYYLHGISVERAPIGGVIMVATDGYALGAMHDSEGYIQGPTQIVRLGKEVISSIKANNKDPRKVWLVIEGQPGNNTISVVLGDPTEGLNVHLPRLHD